MALSWGSSLCHQERGQWLWLCCALMASCPALPWAEATPAGSEGSPDSGWSWGPIPTYYWAPPPGVGGAPRWPQHRPITRDILGDQLLSRGEHLVLNPFEVPRCPRFSKEKSQEQDRGGSRAPRAPRAWRCFLSPSCGRISLLATVTQRGRSFQTSTGPAGDIGQDCGAAPRTRTRSMHRRGAAGPREPRVRLAPGTPPAPGPRRLRDKPEGQSGTAAARRLVPGGPGCSGSEDMCLSLPRPLVPAICKQLCQIRGGHI